MSDLIDWADFIKWISDEMNVTVGDLGGKTRLVHVEDDVTVEDGWELIKRMRTKFVVVLPECTPFDTLDAIYRSLCQERGVGAYAQCGRF